MKRSDISAKTIGITASLTHHRDAEHHGAAAAASACTTFTAA